MKSTQTISAGLGAIVAKSRILAIVSPDSAPIKRQIVDAKDGNRLIDATYGRRTRAVIFLDNGSMVLSSIQSGTLGERMEESHVG